ncbi:hypothetical protein [Nannocystis pusilla]|uniref:hypothetical protein n=1 Tax=Nannocystis pusilla TaxID=889268 RepID=UPI003B770B9D
MEVELHLLVVEVVVVLGQDLEPDRLDRVGHDRPVRGHQLAVLRREPQQHHADAEHRGVDRSIVLQQAPRLGRAEAQELAIEVHRPGRHRTARDDEVERVAEEGVGLDDDLDLAAALHVELDAVATNPSPVVSVVGFGPVVDVVVVLSDEPVIVLGEVDDELVVTGGSEVVGGSIVVVSSVTAEVWLTEPLSVMTSQVSRNSGFGFEQPPASAPPTRIAVNDFRFIEHPP